MLLYVALGGIVLFVLSAYWIQKESRKISTDLEVKIRNLEQRYIGVVDQRIMDGSLKGCDRQIKLNLLTSHVMTKLEADIRRFEDLVKKMKPVAVEVAYEPEFFPILKVFCEEYFMRQEGNTNNDKTFIKLMESVEYAVRSDLEKRLLLIEQSEIPKLQ